MLNFRKLKQDFSSNIVKEGKELFDKKKVVSAKILHLDNKLLRICGRVQGQYENHYESQIEIDRFDCETIDSDCDCPYNHDCQHLAALLFYLEEKLDEIMVNYSKENNLEQLQQDATDEENKSELIEKFREAKTKQLQKEEELYQRQVLQEYVSASHLLSTSPFFKAEEAHVLDTADLAIVFTMPPLSSPSSLVDFHCVFRLPSRSKPLHIPYLKKTLEAIRYEEPIFIGAKRYCFGLTSFPASQRLVLSKIIDQAQFQEQPNSERGYRVGQIPIELLGLILADLFEETQENQGENSFSQEEDAHFLPCVYEGNLENPLRYSNKPALFRFSLEYIEPPVSKILINSHLLLLDQLVSPEEVRFLDCEKPGMLWQNSYFRFSPLIKRMHLKSLKEMRDLTVPKALFGSFMENALPQLTKFAQVQNREISDSFVTIPFAGPLKATCKVGYLDGELEATLFFHYDGTTIPAASSQLSYALIEHFVTPQGILARHLVEERKILEELFQDFTYNADLGVYTAKSDKKIVEFMTDTIPRMQGIVHFECPQNLLDRFIYEPTQFMLNLNPTDRIDMYSIDLKVKGPLKGVRMDLLWDCLSSRRAFIEIETSRLKQKKGNESTKLPKILVLDLDKTTAIFQLFDELGIQNLSDHTLERPLWSLANIDAAQFEGLGVEYHISEKLIDIRQQMLGEKNLAFSPVPAEIQTSLRTYQMEGVQWIERMRLMYLNGILADDMGLGKTLQAIVAITQYRENQKKQAMIVCPTSLLYNWKEEFAKFNPAMTVLIVDGVPSVRKRLLEKIHKYDVIITSYTLLQKDIEIYKQTTFGYLILDEAQHIKNRGTRNAKSVKMAKAEHRLILSGTPIENSLDELWSLFDFLMPGFLSSYDRFVEKYVRSGTDQAKQLEYLRKKVAPFILRRMKSDVLKDLPPVSEIVYHCQLSEVQQELYRSYAQSARDELVRLVERDGFERVQIHVLATLTRLKQICCHPAIFAKEKAEVGDCAKYEMLLELLQTLIEGRHKTVIFSQYTKMLQIMKEDFEKRGIRFVYLDGSSKNRLEIVRQFNEEENISVFLVSLKAGGTGLNLVGADTVIHYDMWWNPAVENQARDRVHRMGQKKNVSAYKLITLGTIEEKIAEMQKRKQGLVKKVVSCDDEAIAKLTWEDVLELLRT